MCVWADTLLIPSKGMAACLDALPGDDALLGLASDGMASHPPPPPQHPACGEELNERGARIQNELDERANLRFLLEVVQVLLVAVSLIAGCLFTAIDFMRTQRRILRAAELNEAYEEASERFDEEVIELLKQGHIRLLRCEWLLDSQSDKQLPQVTEVVAKFAVRVHRSCFTGRVQEALLSALAMHAHVDPLCARFKVAHKKSKQDDLQKAIAGVRALQLPGLQSTTDADLELKLPETAEIKAQRARASFDPKKQPLQAATTQLLHAVMSDETPTSAGISVGDVDQGDATRDAEASSDPTPTRQRVSEHDPPWTNDLPPPSPPPSPPPPPSPSPASFWRSSARVAPEGVAMSSTSSPPGQMPAPVRTPTSVTQQHSTAYGGHWLYSCWFRVYDFLSGKSEAKAEADRLLQRQMLLVSLLTNHLNTWAETHPDTARVDGQLGDQLHIYIRDLEDEIQRAHALDVHPASPTQMFASIARRAHDELTKARERLDKIKSDLMRECDDLTEVGPLLRDTQALKLKLETAAKYGIPEQGWRSTCERKRREADQRQDEQRQDLKKAHEKLHHHVERAPISTNVPDLRAQLTHANLLVEERVRSELEQHVQALIEMITKADAHLKNAERTQADTVAMRERLMHAQAGISDRPDELGCRIHPEQLHAEIVSAKANGHLSHEVAEAERVLREECERARAFMLKVGRLEAAQRELTSEVTVSFALSSFLQAELTRAQLEEKASDVKGRLEQGGLWLSAAFREALAADRGGAAAAVDGGGTVEREVVKKVHPDGGVFMPRYQDLLHVDGAFEKPEEAAALYSRPRRMVNVLSCESCGT